MIYRAYNDILYLCEKYAPSDTLERYDPSMDISVTGAYVPFVVDQLEWIQGKIQQTSYLSQFTLPDGQL